MKNTILITTAVAIIVGGLSFFAGTKYQQKKQTVFRNQFQRSGQIIPGQGNGMRNGNGFDSSRQSFRPVNGEIISADESTIVVKMVDGSSKIVILSEKTEINKADTATKADLKIGEKVAVFGSENSDGSVTAQNIQLNPIIRALSTGYQPAP